MGGQGGKQVWQDEHCDSGRPDVHCKTASLQGKQHRRALKHSLHCLNEENAQRASRQGEGMASFRAQSQAEVIGQWFYHLVACTQPLEFFFIVSGTWSILRRRKTHTLRSIAVIGKDNMWLEWDRKLLRHDTSFGFQAFGSSGQLDLTLASTLSGNPKEARVDQAASKNTLSLIICLLSNGWKERKWNPHPSALLKFCY